MVLWWLALRQAIDTAWCAILLRKLSRLQDEWGTISRIVVQTGGPDTPLDSFREQIWRQMDRVPLSPGASSSTSTLVFSL